MRLHRIRLQNYRGVTDCTVEFAADGVTIIEGDNEVGKTCIPQSLDLILKVPDSSKAKQVLDVRPVHRDAGPEVEVELSSGDYRFVYSKRWHRQPQTRLEILEPRREQLTGREAHQRVTAILDETLDRALWEALCIEQGTELALPLFDVPSLGRALDAAAGGDSTAGREDDLWDRICTERERYWTPTGQPKADRKSVERELADARETTAELAARLEEIARDVTEVDRRLADEKRLVDAREASQQEENELQERWNLLEQCRRDVESFAATHGAAVERRDRIDGETQRRAEQIQTLADRAGELSALKSEAGEAAPALAAIVAHSAATDAELAETLAVFRAAEADARRAVDDRDYLRQRIDVEQLTERHERVVVAQAALATAEAHLDSARVDDELVARIEQAHLGVVRAEAAATGAAASLSVTALSAVGVTIDGDEVVLDAGAEHLAPVVDEVEVIVPDVVRMRVRAGSGSADRAAELDAAREAFAGLCAQGGVADLSEARQVVEARHDAARGRTEAVKVMKQDLRDLTLDILRSKVEGLSRRIELYAAERPAEPPLPDDFEEAKRIASQCDRVVGELQAACDRARAAAGDAAARRQEAELDEAELVGRIANARAARDHAEGLLARARAERPDAALRGALAAAQQEADEARTQLEQAEAALRAGDPVSLELLLRNTSDALGRAVGDFESNRERLRELRISLQLRGEEGLGARQNDALSRCRHVEHIHDRSESRAQAAQLLHDVFAERRQAALRRYAAPFTERIEQLGRIVFGPTFKIELDDDLQVVRRTLDGATLDVDQLSVGAREQLGVLSRLACAAIVSPGGGGAPVVLDDALGWSDPSRLARMGAAIATAGRECQVIVLTCTPGRYAHVGNARVVSLPT